MYSSGENTPIKIYQNTWDNYRSILLGITDLIKPESEEDYIKDRLKMFVTKIEEVSSKHWARAAQAEEEYKKGRMKYGIIGAIAGIIIPLSSIISMGSDYLTVGGIGLIAFPVMGYAVGVKIYDSKFINQ